jgi:hypothetical protein
MGAFSEMLLTKRNLTPKYEFSLFMLNVALSKDSSIAQILIDLELPETTWHSV